MTENDGTYRAEPPRAASAGVLVVHDWYGLLPHVRAASDALAAAGLVALAPDLYGGRIAADPAQAEALMEGMDQAAARARLDEAQALALLSAAIMQAFTFGAAPPRHLVRLASRSPPPPPRMPCMQACTIGRPTVSRQVASACSCESAIAP